MSDKPQWKDHQVENQEEKKNGFHNRGSARNKGKIQHILYL